MQSKITSFVFEDINKSRHAKSSHIVGITATLTVNWSNLKVWKLYKARLYTEKENGGIQSSCQHATIDDIRKYY
jgi:hypothetical protein